MGELDMADETCQKTKLHDLETPHDTELLKSND